MSNYVCKTRTNYFRVKDADEFRTFMSGVRGTEDSIQLWEEKDSKGALVFGFGTLGGIRGWFESATEADDADLDEDVAYDALISGLQRHIADDDAVIIMEAGNEKLRYVSGSALVVTSRATEYFDVSTIAKKNAAKMLGNPQWTTKCEY